MFLWWTLDFKNLYLCCRADMNPMAAIFAIGSDKPIPQLPDKFSAEAKEFVNSCLIRYGLTLSVPNFRRQIVVCFFYFYKLSLGKTFICTLDRLNVKQHRSRWDGSLSHLIWIYAVCKSLLLLPVAVKELNKIFLVFNAPNFGEVERGPVTLVLFTY